MHRKKFIKTGCTVCLGAMAGISFLSLLEGCATGKIIKQEAIENKLTVSTTDFEENKSFIIIRTKSLSYDILVHRNADQTYTALYMQCTHYDNPVFANNKEIFCPSHGSIFDFTGKVLKEPATTNLKQYKTEVSGTSISIYLT